MRTARLETFADGVFAIAATLLVLELRVPEPSDDLAARLADLWPAYAAYVISFMTIGIIWVNHHALLEHCGRADRRFLYLNLLLLVAVAIVPFPTALVGRYILDARAATAALVVYGIGGLLIAIAFSGVFFYATAGGRIIADTAEATRLRRRGPLFTIGLSTYVIAIGLAFVAPMASLAVYALTAAFYALPVLPLPRSR